MRDLQELAGIAQPKAYLFDECPGSLLEGNSSPFSLAQGLATRGARATDRGPHARRQSDFLDKVGRLGIADPEAERLTNATPCLLQRPAVGMASADARHASDPGAALVSLENHSVLGDMTKCKAG
jgi:hypothetical protein